MITRGGVACAVLAAALAIAPWPGGAIGAQGLPAPDRARVQPRRDSLVAMAPSGAVGWMRLVTSIGADGSLRLAETIDVADQVERETLLVADTMFRTRRLFQTGEVYGRPVAVAAGAGDVPDVQAVALLLVATPWAAGAAGAWRLHDAASGGTVTLPVRVEGREAAGWRVAVTREGIVSRYVVSAAPPWRIVAVATDGVPFRFVSAQP